MKKLTAIILSILFCITLTCCGKDDALAGLPEIPRDKRIFYNGTRIEKGEGLDEARPVTACPYDEKPTLEQAEKDGAYIITTYNAYQENSEETVKNVSAMERFARNVNRGIDDSLLVFYVDHEKSGTNTRAYFLYYTKGELKSVYGFGKKYRERLYADGDHVKVAMYEKTKGRSERGIHVPMEYVPIDATVTPDLHHYRPYNFVELTEKSVLYEEGITEKFVNVAGVHEGDGGETKFYEKYPFEEAFPNVKQVFDLGGVVIVDNDIAKKAYNIAAIGRFKENLRNKIPDTLIFYTDNGDISTVMYSYTGESVIILIDKRADGRGDIFTTELFGDKIGLGEIYTYYENTETASGRNTIARYAIHVSASMIDDTPGESITYVFSDVTEIPPIQYVTEHIVHESEAKNFK